MKIHKVVLIYCGVLLTISTFFPWMSSNYPRQYFSLFELNLFTALIIFTIGLITIFTGIYHKPKLGKVYSWAIVLLGSIGYFSISKLVDEIVQINPSIMGIGFFLSLACILTLGVSGLIPTPKENIENSKTIDWRSILMALVGLVLTFVLVFSAHKVIVNYELTKAENKSSSETKFSEEPTKTLPQISITRTKTPTPSNKPQCTHWSKITLADVGRIICVNGIVYDSYWGGDIFYIRFSKEKNSFKFIVLNNYYFKDINGKCVQSTGEIKIFEKVLYMEVREKIYFCEN